jgi:hypothetical protein
MSIYRPKAYYENPSKMDDKGRRYYRGYVIQKKLTGEWKPTHTYHVLLEGKLIAQCMKLQEAVDWITDTTDKAEKDAR